MESFYPGESTQIGAESQSQVGPADVIVSRQIPGILFHDDPAILDHIAPIDGFQALAHVLLGNEKGNFLLDLPRAG